MADDAALGMVPRSLQQQLEDAADAAVDVAATHEAADNNNSGSSTPPPASPLPTKSNLLSPLPRSAKKRTTARTIEQRRQSELTSRPPFDASSPLQSPAKRRELSPLRGAPLTIDLSRPTTAALPTPSPIRLASLSLAPSSNPLVFDAAEVLLPQTEEEALAKPVALSMWDVIPTNEEQQKQQKAVPGRTVTPPTYADVRKLVRAAQLQQQQQAKQQAPTSPKPSCSAGKRRANFATPTKAPQEEKQSHHAPVTTIEQALQEGRPQTSEETSPSRSNRRSKYTRVRDGAGGGPGTPLPLHERQERAELSVNPIELPIADPSAGPSIAEYNASLEQLARVGSRAAASVVVPRPREFERIKGLLQQGALEAYSTNTQDAAKYQALQRKQEKKRLAKARLDADAIVAKHVAEASRKAGWVAEEEEQRRGVEVRTHAEREARIQFIAQDRESRLKSAAEFRESEHRRLLTQLAESFAPPRNGVPNMLRGELLSVFTAKASSAEWLAVFMAESRERYRKTLPETCKLVVDMIATGVQVSTYSELVAAFVKQIATHDQAVLEHREQLFAQRERRRKGALAAAASQLGLSSNRSSSTRSSSVPPPAMTTEELVVLLKDLDEAGMVIDNFEQLATTLSDPATLRTLRQLKKDASGRKRAIGQVDPATAEAVIAETRAAKEQQPPQQQQPIGKAARPPPQVQRTPSKSNKPLKHGPNASLDAKQLASPFAQLQAKQPKQKPLTSPTASRTPLTRSNHPSSELDSSFALHIENTKEQEAEAAKAKAKEQADKDAQAAAAAAAAEQKRVTDEKLAADEAKAKSDAAAKQQADAEAAEQAKLDAIEQKRLAAESEVDEATAARDAALLAEAARWQAEADVAARLAAEKALAKAQAAEDAKSAIAEPVAPADVEPTAPVAAPVAAAPEAVSMTAEEIALEAKQVARKKAKADAAAEAIRLVEAEKEAKLAAHLKAKAEADAKQATPSPAAVAPPATTTSPTPTVASASTPPPAATTTPIPASTPAPAPAVAPTPSTSVAVPAAVPSTSVAAASVAPPASTPAAAAPVSTPTVAAAAPIHAATAAPDAPLSVDDVPRVAADLQARAIALIANKQYAEGLDSAEAQLNLVEGAYGHIDARLLPSLELCAVCHEKLDAPADALPFLFQTLQIHSAAHGRAHPLVADVLQRLGAALVLLGEGEDAFNVCMRVYLIRRDALGPTHADTVQARETVLALTSPDFACDKLTLEEIPLLAGEDGSVVEEAAEADAVAAPESPVVLPAATADDETGYADDFQQPESSQSR